MSSNMGASELTNIFKLMEIDSLKIDIFLKRGVGISALSHIFLHTASSICKRNIKLTLSSRC